MGFPMGFPVETLGQKPVESLGKFLAPERKPTLRVLAALSGRKDEKISEVVKNGDFMGFNGIIIHLMEYTLW